MNRHNSFKRHVGGAFAAAMMLIGCGQDGGAPARDNAVSVAPERQSTVASEEVATPAPKQTDPALEPTIPEAIRGVWRESEGQSVSAAECDLTSYENSTRTLTIQPERFTQFETGGRLLDVLDRSETRIRAVFDTTYADTPTRGEYVMELRDDGRTLIVEEIAEGGRGPVRHRRCPS